MPTPLALLIGVPAPVAAPLEDAMVSVEPTRRRDGMTMTPAVRSEVIIITMILRRRNNEMEKNRARNHGKAHHGKQKDKKNGATSKGRRVPACLVDVAFKVRSWIVPFPWYY